MELGSLNYRIAADTASLSSAERELDKFTDTAQRAEREVDSLGRSTKTAGSTTVASTTRMQRGFRDVQGAVERANSQLSSLDSIARGVAAGIAAIGFAQLGRDAYTAIAGSQQLQASLKTVTGSIEAANAAWNRLLQFAKETPYGLDQSVNAFIRMKSLGLDPTEEALTSFGNTSAAMGKDLMQMIEAVADASTGEFERLKEFGIRASQQGDQVSFVFQGVTTTVAKNAQAITAYLESIGKTTFAGAMADQMDTLNGQMSNLEDGVYQLWLAVGDRGATDAFSGAIAQAAQAVDGLTGAINNGAFDWLFDAIGDINKQGDEFIKWVSQVHGEYTDTMNAIEAANLRTQASWIDLKAMAVQSFNGIVGGASEVINSGLIPIQKALNALDQTFANLLKNIGGALGPAGKQFLDWANDIESGMIEPIGISIQRMGDYVSSAKEQSDALRRQADALGQASGKADELSDSSDTVTRTTTNTTKSLQSAAKAASQFDDALLKLIDSLNPLQASQRQYMQDQLLLQNAWVTGRITAIEYFDALQKLNQAQISSQTASQAYSVGFGSEIGSRGGVGSPTDQAANDSEWDTWLESARTAFSDFDNLNKQAAESFTQGFGNALESMVFDFEDLGSAAQGVFENIARSVVNALGQMAAQWVAYQAIQIATGQSAQAAATAGAAATGAGMAAAYAPAAALASLASFGANAVPAQAGLTATTALASSLAASSGFAGLFDKGGNIRAGQFGIVGERGPEIVNGPANITGRRDTARMMSSGVGGRAANDEGGGYKNVTINNYGSNEVVQTDDGNGGLTIDIVKAELAKDFRTNGKVSQAGQQNFKWQRKGR